jgi:hypothetical protein
MRHRASSSNTVSLLAAVLLAFVVAVPSHAQMAHRLKGSLRTTTGAPVANAGIRADNITGFRGEQFVGQKDHAVTAAASGEFSIAGIESGLWLFSSSAPGTIPAVMVLPVKFAQRQQVSATGNALTWQLAMFAYPAADHPMLKPVVDLLEAGKKDEAMQALTFALGPDVPTETRVAAGELAMLGRQEALAKTIFAMVLQKEARHPRALLGSAMASLLGRDWEGAGKALWDARDLAPRELRPALASAIDDLRIARVQ